MKSFRSNDKKIVGLIIYAYNNMEVFERVSTKCHALFI